MDRKNNRITKTIGKNKKLFVLLFFVIISIIFVQIYSIYIKYGLSIYEYIKYSMPLNEKEIEYLEENELIFGMDRMAPPLSFVNPENNQNTGMVVEFVSQLSIDISKNIRYRPLEWSVLLDELEKGNINIADLFESEERDKKFLFTQPLYVLNGKILGDDTINNRELTEIDNTRIAIVKGDYMEEMASKYFINSNNIEFVYTSDIRKALELLIEGEVNGVAGDETVIAYIINDMGYEDKYKFIDDSLYTKNVCLATSKNNKILIDILNKGIMSLKKQNLIVQTQDKWFSGYEPEVLDIKEYDVLTKTITIALLMGLFGILWNFTLANRVKIRTEELNENKESLRIILDTLHDGLIVINNENVVEECNDSVTKLLGLSTRDIIGRKYSEIDELFPYVEHLLDEELTESDSERMIRIKNSYFLVTKRLFRQEKNKMLIAIADYTEKHINERRARQESKMIAVGQLSAGLAHEIRNPLGLIRSYVFVLDRHSDEKDKHAVRVIDESVQRINGLIENLLSFSRLSMEENKVFDLKKLIESIVVLEKKKLDNKKIEIVIEIPDNTIVKTNEEILKMCIMNLINNSIDAFPYAKPGNMIKIAGIIAKDGSLELTVEDNGAGVDEDALENIFNPFFTTKKDGTGLGLYIINNELTRINGKISIESEKNIGTKFIINIPLLEGNINE